MTASAHRGSSSAAPWPTVRPRRSPASRPPRPWTSTPATARTAPDVGAAHARGSVRDTRHHRAATVRGLPSGCARRRRARRPRTPLHLLRVPRGEDAGARDPRDHARERARCRGARDEVEAPPLRAEPEGAVRAPHPHLGTRLSAVRRRAVLSRGRAAVRGRALRRTSRRRAEPWPRRRVHVLRRRRQRVLPLAQARQRRRCHHLRDRHVRRERADAHGPRRHGDGECGSDRSRSACA